MKTTGLMIMVMLLSCYVPVLAQNDSGKAGLEIPVGVADSNNGAAVDTAQALENVPAITAHPATAQDTVQQAVPGALSDQPPGYSVLWVAAAAMCGIVIGAAGFRLMASRKRDAADDAPLEGSRDSADQAGAGQEPATLIDQNQKLMAENERLKRELDSLEERQQTPQPKEEASAQKPVEELVFFMPQPNMNGKFQEASKRRDASEALYAFHVNKDNKDIASFELIARDAYLNAAIGNEPTWIAVACERTNQPSATTSRVRTDSPGQASLKNGEWEIIRKAKITYL